MEDIDSKLAQLNIGEDESGKIKSVKTLTDVWNWLTLFLIRGIGRKLEVETSVGKADVHRTNSANTLFLRYKASEEWRYQLFHAENFQPVQETDPGEKSRKKTNSDNLNNLFCSYLQARQEIKDNEIKNFIVICSKNIDEDINREKGFKLNRVQTPSRKDILKSLLEIDQSQSQLKYYKFEEVPDNIFNANPDMCVLAKKLLKYAHIPPHGSHPEQYGKNLHLNAKIFKTYHLALVNNNILQSLDKTTFKFNAKFLNKETPPSSEGAKSLLAYLQKEGTDIRLELVTFTKGKYAEFGSSSDVNASYLPLPNDVKREDILEFLEKLIFVPSLQEKKAFNELLIHEVRNYYEPSITDDKQAQTILERIIKLEMKNWSKEKNLSFLSLEDGKRLLEKALVWQLKSPSSPQVAVSTEEPKRTTEHLKKPTSPQSVECIEMHLNRSSQAWDNLLALLHSEERRIAIIFVQGWKFKFI